MILQLLAGLVWSITCVIVHTTSLVALFALIRSHYVSTAHYGLIPRMARIMTVTVTFLFIMHLVEVVMWAVLYWAVGAVPDAEDALYASFGNYATLGFGEGLHMDQWRLLAPMTAMNGVLLFGLSTAVMFAVMSRIYRLTHNTRRRAGHAGPDVSGL